MRFVYPESTYWLVVLPIALVFVVFIYRRSQSMVLNWFGSNDYTRSFPREKGILRMLGIFFAFLSLLGIYWQKKEEDLDIMGREIYIVLDVSASMNTQDVRPSRLEKAEKELQRLLENIKGDHVGLIVFASHPYVSCPITRDLKAVSMFLSLTKTDQFAQTSTDIRGALLKALDRFMSEEQRSKRISRAVILVSDGEDFGENYTSVIERLQKNGVKVFPVGVGTLEGGPVPEIVNGKSRGHKRRQDGSTAISTLQEENLRMLGDEFSTGYVCLDGPGKNLNGVAEEIRMMSASPLTERKDKVESNHFQWFLFLAIAFLGASMVIMPIRKGE